MQNERFLIESLDGDDKASKGQYVHEKENRAMIQLVRSDGQSAQMLTANRDVLSLTLVDKPWPHSPSAM